MCMTASPATLSSTRIYAAEVLKPDGTMCHVLGYQNLVEAERGPNAMLLPFPSRDRVTPGNLVNAAGFPTILDAYERAIQRQHATLSRRVTKSAPAVSVNQATVFESGSYTVVLAENATALLPALRLVPTARRPAISNDLVDALSHCYPNWPLALCCFDGRGAMRGGMAPEPLFWWYVPRHPDGLFAPALDAHDGGPPALDALVSRDHVVAFGSYTSKMRSDLHLRYEIDTIVPVEHRWMFVDRVHGNIFRAPTQNGDFLATTYDTREQPFSSLAKVTVTTPPYARAIPAPSVH